MLLSKLFSGAPDMEIRQLSVDSRMPMEDAIFFCLNGIKYDGHDYIDEAVKNGAKVIIYTKEIERKEKAIYIKVADVNKTLKKTANIFYGDPGKDIDEYVIGGNYGRCSVALFINHFLNKKEKCGYVGILGIRYDRTELKSSVTTLNALENLKILQTMKENGISSCTFEANASSLNLQKLDSIDPSFFIYTSTDTNSNESQLNEYFSYFRRYLYTLEIATRVIFNAVDVSYMELSDCVENYFTYGLYEDSDYRISDVSLSSHGISFSLSHEGMSYPVVSSLQGMVNVYNLTAAIAALNQKGHPLDKIIEGMKDVPCVDGVMERCDTQYNVIVDSAYDISSINEICRYARKAADSHKAIGVISINYTDGDNRLEKIMQICQSNLDVIILTENESLEGEVMNILSRCDRYTRKDARVIHCDLRSQAIKNAIEIMNQEDTLIIIGKGNEKYLNMGLGKEFYQGDRFYVQKYLEKRKRGETDMEE